MGCDARVEEETNAGEGEEEERGRGNQYGDAMQRH